MCQSAKWAEAIGALEWEECHNPTSQTLYFIPADLRSAVKAAGTAGGYADTYDVCDECACIIRSMCEEEGEWGIWANLDAEPAGY